MSPPALRRPNAWACASVNRWPRPEALLPKAVFLPADVAADRAALRQLALDCQRFSPLVGLEEGPHPESLLCDVNGCTHLWDGEDRFLQDVRRLLARARLSRPACAGLLGGCRLGARSHRRPPRWCPRGMRRRHCRGFPWLLCGCRQPLWSVWKPWDCGRSAMSCRLPRETLASRFGVILPRRLDQALGLLPESFVVRAAQGAALGRPRVGVADRRPPRPGSRLPADAARASVDGRSPRHGSPGIGGELQTEAGPVTIDLRLVEPTRDERHLAQLLELHLERRTWSGGVLAVRWAALRLGRSEQAQGCWFGDDAGTRTSRSFNSLVDRLSSRLEARPCCESKFFPTHSPSTWSDSSRGRTSNRRSRSGSRCPRNSLAAVRSRLLGIPQPIDVSSIVPDGPPDPHGVAGTGQSRGPLLGAGADRDGLVACAGRRARLLPRRMGGRHPRLGLSRPRNGRWFLHGFFD